MSNSSVKPGVCPWDIFKVSIPLTHASSLFVGSKDRLHKAKTIDLCQNPLTVSPFLHKSNDHTHRTYRKSLSSLELAKYPSGRNMTGKSRALRGSLPMRESYIPTWLLPMPTYSPMRVQVWLRQLQIPGPRKRESWKARWRKTLGMSYKCRYTFINIHCWTPHSAPPYRAISRQFEYSCCYFCLHGHVQHTTPSESGCCSGLI